MTPTRFPALLLDKVSPTDWRFADADTGQHVGDRYRTKTEALADLERYHREAWEGATV
jgi:hypothetical protein